MPLIHKPMSFVVSECWELNNPLPLVEHIALNRSIVQLQWVTVRESIPSLLYRCNVTPRARDTSRLSYKSMDLKLELEA